MKPDQECLGGTTRMHNSETQTKFIQHYAANSNQNHHYAPFLIKSKRFDQKILKNQTPAIGTYNLPSCFQRKRSPFEEKMDKLILQAQKKKQHSSIFKSSCSRFGKIKQEIPGPASYNLFKSNTPKGSNESKTILGKQKKLNELTRTCPSIPFKDNKYGYAFADGIFKKIEKGSDQLQLEKQSRKQYVETLKCQMHFKRSSEGNDSNQVVSIRKLYNAGEKIINRDSLQPNTPEKSIYLPKKPKIQHLHHSKGVSVSENHKLLGPGQYNVMGKQHQNHSKNENFQFFGSSEVRFKGKMECQPKGYSMIEMIKQTKKHQKKQPLKRASNISQQTNKENKVVYPGPGQYNPDDSNKKLGRGNTLFTQSQRFKQMYPQKREFGQYDAVDQIQRRKVQVGSLKKDRFKPIHQVYEPLQSNQLGGITNDFRKKINNIPGLANQKSYQSPQIKSWSRDQKRNSRQKQGYIRELKQKLDIITSSPKAAAQRGLYKVK